MSNLSNYYTCRFAKLIRDLLLAVVGVALLYVAYSYGRLILSTEAFDLVTKLQFWQRIYLFFIVLGFVSYDLLAYHLQVDFAAEYKGVVARPAFKAYGVTSFSFWTSSGWAFLLCCWPLSGSVILLSQWNMLRP